MSNQVDTSPQPDAGPRVVSHSCLAKIVNLKPSMHQAKRAKVCFDAAAATEYMVALILEGAKRSKLDSPWHTRNLINSVDKDGRTAMHAAAERGHTGQ